MTATYFANTMGVMWASIEATTLSVAVLIYHDRTKLSVEATWKYTKGGKLLKLTQKFTSTTVRSYNAYERGEKE